MREFEESAGSAAAAKEKIRARYKGVNPDELEVIPALPKDNIFEESKLRRVAVYARVSTGDPRQTSSYLCMSYTHEMTCCHQSGMETSDSRT